jgi:hypothetical protein
LLARREIALCLASVAATTAVESVLVLRTYGFWMGTPLFVASLGAITGLILLAYRLPAPLVGPPSQRSRTSRFTFGAVGFVLFPTLFAIEYGPAGTSAAAPIAFGVELGVLAGFALWVVGRLGGRTDDHGRVCFALGLLCFLAGFGVAITLPVPYTLPLAFLVVLFAHRLEKAYRREREPSEEGAGPGGPTSA